MGRIARVTARLAAALFALKNGIPSQDTFLRVLRSRRGLQNGGRSGKAIIGVGGNAWRGRVCSEHQLIRDSLVTFAYTKKYSPHTCYGSTNILQEAPKPVSTIHYAKPPRQ